MIPKILHYVWVGSKLPAKQRAFIDSWRITNPDYEIMCWNEDNVDFTIPMLKQAYKDRKWSKIADVVRLMAVYEHGGIYLDTDFRVFKPLDTLLQHQCFFSFQDENVNPDWVANGVFGAEPKHWFIRSALFRVLSIPRLPFGMERPTKFGPKLITKMLRDEGLNRYSPSGVQVKDIFIYPTQVFFPFKWTETFTPECVTSETLAAHFWEKSWAESIPLPLRMISNVRALMRSERRLAT